MEAQSVREGMLSIEMGRRKENVALDFSEYLQKAVKNCIGKRLPGSSF